MNGVSARATTTAAPGSGLFFDQFDSQVGVIGVLAGPGGLRATGWDLRAQGASTEPDETVQVVIGQLREYFAGDRPAASSRARSVRDPGFMQRRPISSV